MSSTPGFVFAPFRLDLEQHQLWRGTERIPLRPKAFAVLHYLVAHAPRLVTPAELLQAVWADTYMSEGLLRSYMRELRVVLGDEAKTPQFIATVARRGWRFVASVTTAPPPVHPPGAVQPCDATAAPVPAYPPAPLPPVAPPMPEVPDSPRTHRMVAGEHKQVTVLVAGLHGVTMLAQAIETEVLYEVLTRTATLMRDAVERFAGTVIQCSGERLVALFGAPLAQEDHVVRALQAALGVQRTVATYAEELRHTRAFTLELGVGVHTGPVVLGPLGPDARLDASVQGFPVHLAERLQTLAAGGAIYVSAAVWQQAGDFFRFEDHGARPVPEIAQPVRVYTCTGVAPVASRLEAFLRRHQSTFLGREPELDLLGTLWERVCRGQGQVVVLFGEAGVGKSRLAYEFQRTLPEGHTLDAHTLSYGQAMPYHAMLPLLRTVLGLTDQALPAQQRQAIHACLAAAQPSLAADASLLAHLLSVPLESASLPPLPPEEQQRRLQHACVQVLLQHAAAQPLCLLIEDLHWLDSSSQELLDLLVTALAGYPILVLGTARPGFRDPWTDHTYYHRLTVAPLSDALTETFIHHYLQPYGAAAALTALIRARTGGNPFFLEEMLRTLQEQGRIVVQNDVYVLTPDASLALPASIQGMLAARIDRLPAEAKDLLQTAAVLGRDVPVALLGTVAELPDAALQQGLRHLQAAEFLYETRLFPALVYTFKHALTHDVAYGSLLQERRRALHARTVEALETLAGDREDEQVEILAQHAVRGQVWEKALRYLHLAGVKASGRSTYREAVAYLEQALDALHRLPEQRSTHAQAIALRLALCEALAALGELGRVTEVVREAERLAEGLDDAHRLGQVSLFLSADRFWMGEYDGAIAIGQRVLNLATASGHLGLQVGGHYYLSMDYFHKGAYRQAIDCCRWTVATLDGAQLHERFGHNVLPAVKARQSLAWNLAELGEFAEALAYGAESLRIAETAAHPITLVYACLGVGVPYLRQGAYDKALPQLERAVGICRDLNIMFHFPAAAFWLGTAYTLTGQVTEALTLLEQALAQERAMGRQGAQAAKVAVLSQATLLAGHPEHASDLARHALELAHRHGERGEQAYILRLLGDIAVHGAPLDAEKAQAHYQQALTLAEELGMRPLQAHCHRSLGTLYAQMRQREQAHSELTTAMALYRALAMPCWFPQTAAALVRMASVPSV